ncbi:uncharacterized protein LOC100841257 [Brachypodium distachyon]|uniref:Uncharacterized protein n=1 Tax=Brachypodium distachyon TaxID=15368 RepID=I1IHS5_BRADI|nr:uncharacterized protein LOC100841257 [Brachypodium distachyon]KQJ86443.1 hypothetical protein BRADI_4g05517v3 [Brachypodium distachyon]|eukprot:XP_024310457.1 uncharacterized protein LOC100841257 [Brachypodium distachyon]
MSDSEASPRPAVAVSTAEAEASAGENSPSPARNEALLPVGEKISELNESQTELLGRLRGLKEDLQSWRNNLDTQVQKYKSEISDIKTALNSEIDQLRSDFQELRTTLKKQQEDVSISLKNLGLEDATENDGKNGTVEENTSVGALLASPEIVKLDDNLESHEESSAVNEEKNETAEDGSGVAEDDSDVVKDATETESASDK